MATTKITIDAISYTLKTITNTIAIYLGDTRIGTLTEISGENADDAYFYVRGCKCQEFKTMRAAIRAAIELHNEAERAEIEAVAAEAQAAEQAEAEQAAPVALPLHVNVEIDKRMRTNPAALFDMQALTEWARVMPINATTQAGGEIYYLWGASEFPAFMGADGTAEIWAFPDARPCRWLSISLGTAPRTAYVPENWDEVEQRAEFYRDDDALPF